MTPFDLGCTRMMRVAQGALAGAVVTGAAIGHHRWGFDPSYAGSGFGALLMCAAIGKGWF